MVGQTIECWRGPKGSVAIAEEEVTFARLERIVQTMFLSILIQENIKGFLPRPPTLLAGSKTVSLFAEEHLHDLSFRNHSPKTFEVPENGPIDRRFIFTRLADKV